MLTCEEEPSLARVKADKRAQKHFRVGEFDVPKLDFRTKWICKVEELEQLTSAWNRLIDTAVRPNPFFDPDFLLPAMRYLASGEIVVLAVMARPRANPNGEEVLCGLMPLKRRRFYGLPLSCWEIWKHEQCFDCTPLVRSDCAAEVFEFMLQAIYEETGTSLLSLDTVVGEGNFANLLTDNLASSGRRAFYRRFSTRACFRPMQDAETYICTRVSKNTRKGTQRLKRKLAAQGSVRTEFSTRDSLSAIEEFMQLEDAGWKGASGSSFGSTPRTAKFFREMASRMLNNGTMTIARTTFQGKPAAIAFDLKQGKHAAHFKTTYSESLEQYSPGLILELDSIDHLHKTDLSFVDSCADPMHSMINRVWADRTRVQSMVVSLGGHLSALAVSGMPMLQHLSKFVSKRR